MTIIKKAAEVTSEKKNNSDDKKGTGSNEIHDALKKVHRIVNTKLNQAIKIIRHEQKKDELEKSKSSKSGKGRI